MDLGPYLLRLAILLPLTCALIVGGLWLAKRYGGGVGLAGMGGGGRARAARLADTLVLAPGARLAVVDFGERRLLISVGRAGMALIAEVPAPAPLREVGRVA